LSTKSQELGKLISSLRQIVVGKVALPTDQIDQITLFIFLKQLSDKHDDLIALGSKEAIFTGEWESYHFNNLVSLSGQNLVDTCKKAIESLYRNPNIDVTVRKVFERSYLKISEPKILSSFILRLSEGFKSHFDLGDFYESLLPIIGTQNELGQFRTPRHIIDFIVDLIEPVIGERIADPACGSAGFLVSSFRHLLGKYSDENGLSTLNPEQSRQLYNEMIFGWDMEPLMVKFSLANLYLHGLRVPNVAERDTLLSDSAWDETFDVFVANPPFITPEGGANRHGRFANTSNKTEVLFCEYMVHALNINGRMGVVVPEGILFDASRGHRDLRESLISNGLWAVVSLPEKVFSPYSAKKTNIIFLDKTIKTDEILFIEIKNHGFSLNTNPAPVKENDLPEAAEQIRDFYSKLKLGKAGVASSKLAYTVPTATILSDEIINLTGLSYNRSSKETTKWHMVTVGDVAKISAGGAAPQGPEFFEGGIHPFIRTSDVGRVHISDDFQDVRDHLNDLGIEKLKLFPRNTILMPKSGASTFLNHRVLMGRPAYVVSHLATIQADETKIHPKYLFHLLVRIDARDLTNSQDYPTLKAGDIAKIRIPLPPMEHQLRIVDELESIKIEKLKSLERIRSLDEDVEVLIDEIYSPK
jgi:type I restriction enzyme M protein